jgi:hypothetical protein
MHCACVCVPLACAERDELLRYLTSAEFRAHPLSYNLLAFMAEGSTGPADVLMAQSDRVVKASRNSAGAGVWTAPPRISFSLARSLSLSHSFSRSLSLLVRSLSTSISLSPSPPPSPVWSSMVLLFHRIATCALVVNCFPVIALRRGCKGDIGH